MIRLFGFLLFLASLGGGFVTIAYVATGEYTVPPGEILDDAAKALPLFAGDRYPLDVLMLAGSLFLLLAGLKLTVFGVPRKPSIPPPPRDPDDEKAMRRYQIQMASIKPIPRMPTAMILNSYVILTLLGLLVLGGMKGKDAFLLGVLAATLGVSILVGLFMLFLAMKVEKSLGTFKGMLSLLVHLGAIIVVAAAAALSIFNKN